ncbi:hypothetical protein RJT34_31725 [Clitoria ternatea]|uniref:Uncharacterized protein n=1 Tax=Clitoria ternatea TaxID=43366 RepID=A0AAN9EWX9_CLITE
MDLSKSTTLHRLICYDTRMDFDYSTQLYVAGGSTCKVKLCLKVRFACVVHTTYCEENFGKLVEAFDRIVYNVIFPDNVSQEHLLPSLGSYFSLGFGKTKDDGDHFLMF